MPVKPEHLDYANAQILMIGEDLEESHALDAAPKDEKSSEKETPREELEKMHKEDHERVEHLKGEFPSLAPDSNHIEADVYRRRCSLC